MTNKRRWGSFEVERLENEFCHASMSVIVILLFSCFIQSPVQYDSCHLSSQACEKKKRAKKMRAEAKFSKAKGKGSKGRGKGRGKFGRARGAKGRGKGQITTETVEPEVSAGEPPVVRRRLSFGSHVDEVEASSLDAQQAQDLAVPDPAGDAAPDLADFGGDVTGAVPQNLGDVAVGIEGVPGDLGDVPGDSVPGHLGGGDACMQSEVEASLPEVPELSKSPLSMKENNSEASEAEPESKLELVMADTLDADTANVAEPASSSAAPSVIETAVVAPSACGTGPARPKIHHTPPALAAAAPPGCSLILNCNLAPMMPKSAGH